MTKRLSILLTVLGMILMTAPAQADWDPGDGHKMHFPQLPDPNGWDVSFTHGALGDDWMCSQTGPVNDIHMWLSFRDGLDPVAGTYVWGSAEIWSDVPVGFDPDPTIQYSHPGTLLWAMNFNSNDMPNVKLRHYGVGDQGWLEPPTGFTPNDHQNFYQLNIDPIDSVLEPFIQQQGTIYWLVVRMNVEDPRLGPYLPEVGWKTSTEQFNDAAVYQLPVPGGVLPDHWEPLLDQTGAPLDLAFVITPEPATLALLSLGTLVILRRR